MIGQKFLDLIFRVKADKAKKDIDDVGKGLKKVGTGGKVAQGGLMLMGKGFKFVGASMKAAGIGLIVALMASLTQVFTQNQQVMDGMQKVMIKLQPIFKALGDVIAVVVRHIESLIDAVMSAASWIGDLIGVEIGAGAAANSFATDLVNLRNEVKLMNAELALTQLQYQKEAEIQRQLRDDTSLTIDERIRANERLGEVLKEQMEVETEAAEKALRLAKMELSLDSDNIDKQVALTDAKVKLMEIDERLTSQRSEQLTNLNSLEQERIDLEKTASEKRQSQLDELLKLQNKDLEVREKITSSINKQLETAKNAHKQTMTMLRQEMEAKLLIAKQAEERRLKDVEEQRENLEKELAFNERLIKKGILEEENRKEASKKKNELLALAFEELEIMVGSVRDKSSIQDEFNALMGEQRKEFNNTQEQLVLQAQRKLDEHFETAKQKEIRETQEKYDALYGLAENSFFDTMRLRIEEGEALKSIDEKYENERLAGSRKFFARMRELGKKQADIEIQREEGVRKKKMELAQQALGLGMSLAEEGTAAQKQLAMASTIMSTYAGATQAFDDPLMPTPLKFVQAGLIIAAGIKNLAEINKTKVPGESGGQGMTDTLGGGDMGGDVPTLPTFGAIGTEPPPIQAFVVETDVSNAQALQNELDLQSTL